MYYYRNSLRSVIFLAIMAGLFIGSCTSQNMANHFNKDASDPDNKPDKVIKSLKIKSGDHIADIGSGGGYFTLRFAKEVGEKGRVYAVDIEQDYLDIISGYAKRDGLKNITTVLAKEDQSLLPKKSIDLIFVRNVYHHLPEQIEYFKKIREVLKPRGRVVIIEYKCEGIIHGLFGHCVSQDIVVKDMDKAGYSEFERHDFMPEQSLTIFTMKK